MTQVYGASFRWIKVKYDLTSSGGDDLVRFDGLNVTLDVKQKADFGEVAAVSTDAGGTTVNFNAAFTEVSTINVTPNGTAARIAVYDFAGAPNPTSFKVLLFDTAGTRVSGNVGWTARGY